MKICPICDATFDEEIIRFCTKDGTPLIESEEPNFAELPSESINAPADADFGEDDDIGEITVIRRKDVPAPPPSIDELNAELRSPASSERIVIPTAPVDPVQNVRTRTAAAYYPPVEKPNTLKVVVLTVIGTISLLGLGALLFWFLQKETPANTNANLNTNLGSFNGNLNSNVNTAIDSNFNFNMNSNFNSNYNLNSNFNTNTNANVKTPTPTPKPSPSPSPSPSPDASATPTPTRTPAPANTNRPAPSPTPRMGPRPTPNPVRTPGT